MLPDHMIVCALFGQSHLVVVQTSVGVVVVSEFWEIAYSFVRLLEDRNADGHIVGCSQVLSILILEVFFLYVPE